ncbi:MAG TPA: putative Ig domain-containing protein, partial [Lysobacter sp.]
DRAGQLVARTVDEGGLSLKTTYAWDGRGSQLSVTEAAGTAAARTTVYAYDMLGHRISETVDPGAGRLNLTTSYAYDGNDNLVSRTDASGRTTRYTYDEANRRIFVVDGAGGVVQSWYDANGRVVATRAYAQAIDLAGLPAVVTTAAVEARLGVNDARDVQNYTVYDGDGRVRLSVDGAGAVIETRYDAAGRAVQTRAYANALALPSYRAALQTGEVTSANLLAGIVPDATRDHIDSSVLDVNGRVRFAIAGDGSVREWRYDPAGRVSQAWVYANALQLSQADRTALADGALAAADVAVRVSSQQAQARAEYRVYDAAGRQRFIVVRSGATMGVAAETRYDAGGRAIAQVQYGIEVAFDPADTEAELALSLQSAAQRTTRFVYDRAGRQRFSVDASGAVSETRYDAAGRVTDTLVYANRAPAGTTGEVSLASWAQTQAASQVRRTHQDYDGAGRLRVRTDAMNQAEYFGYDGAGMLTTYTDRNGAVWTYAYDGAGRRVAEFSPQVSVAVVDPSGSVGVATRSIVTRIGYDALGNVTSRTEDADAPVQTGAYARTTLYEYDNRGNQIRTRFPDAYYIDAANQLVPTGQTSTIDVVYDVLGRAVVQKDVQGRYSYRTYDALGRLAYETDAEGYVTSYAYDAFGDQTRLTRHAARINTAALAGWSAGQALGLAQMTTSGVVASGASDRTLTSAYDMRGQKSAVFQSQVTYYTSAGTLATGSPTTRFQYDAYGQLVLESVLLEGDDGQANARWANTWHYYDALGRDVLTVDAEGYATSTSYNATGEVVETIEHARALDTVGLTTTAQPGAPATGDAVTGYDRVMRWTYDALGRKASETAVRRYQRTDGSAGVRDVTTSFQYDGEGRVTQAKSDAGITATTYDALGRVVGVKEPERATVAAASTEFGSISYDLSTATYAQVSPYTAMAYDAFGNLVRTRRYANGVASGESAPAADDTRDQIEVTLHDHQGRAVMTRDSYGKAVYSNYDAADNLTFRWYDLTGSAQNARIETRFTYDGLGRLAWQEQRRGATIEMSETLGHNAFGEVVTKQQGGLAGTLMYTYDAAGRLVSNNEGGATQQFGYNLAGHQVRHSRIAYLDGASSVEAVTWNTTDRLGRAVQQRLPGYNDAGATPTILQQWDRWGNVLQIIDARGYQTNYQYNDFNQIVRDERPLVEVMNSANQLVWQRPVNQWFYDAWGRLVATLDANGNLRSNEYDDAGRLVKVTDALGNSTRYAYDALGNERFAQNALGYLTFKQYDRMGRLTTIGDYLLNANATQRDRAVLQSYLLNENGDRIRVTDALNNAVQYDYDGSNRLIRSQTAMGVVTQYGYDVQGHRTREDNALSLNGSLTVADPETGTAKVNQLSWAYDIYGRLVDHNNLSGRDSDYAYDAASGQLTVESSSGGYAITSGNGQKITKYFANGRIREITEYNGSVDKNAGANVYRYAYDAAGNVVREEVITFDGDGQAVHTITKTQYDSNGRIARVIQEDVTTGKTVFDLNYSYDAVGNRRRVQTRTSYGPNTDTFTADNQAPVTAQPVADRTVRKGMTSEFRVRVSDVFRDAEQDALSVQVTRSDGSALPSWLAVRFDATTGELVFTASPAAGAADEDVGIKLVAVETATSRSAPAVFFTVRARVNTTPQLIDGGVQLFHAKTERAWAQELAAGSYFTDLDVGDRLTLSVDNAASLPSWLTVDVRNPSVVRLSGTPTTAEVVTLYLRATDEKGASVVKTVQISAAPNAAPNVVGTPSGGEAILGRPYVWLQPLSALFSDPNADTMRVTASGLASWMTFTYLADRASPQLRLDGQVPSTEQDGRVYPITFTAIDTDGASSTVTINVTVRANRAPSVNYPAGWSLPSVRIGDMLDTSVAIATLFGDVEGDQVSPSWINVPSWMTVTVDQTAGLIRFKGKPTSNASHAGDISFQIRGTDIGGLSSLATVRIHVGTDYSPVRSSVPVNDAVLSIGRTFSYTLPADMFVELEGDGMTYSVSGAYEYSWVEDTIPPTPMTEVYQQPLPAWMSFDAATRTLSGTVPAGTAQTSFVVRVQARDSRGNYTGWSNRIGQANVSGDYDITFKVQPFVNSAPIYNAGSLPARQLNHGTYVDLALPAGAFVEPDGDAMTYRAMVREPGYWDWVNTSDDPMEPFYEQV